MINVVFTGNSRVYKSIDTPPSNNENDDPTIYNLEFLNSLTPQGMPVYNLCLKVGAIVMLLRNMNISKGMCNGTRLSVEAMNDLSLYCKVW